MKKVLTTTAIIILAAIATLTFAQNPPHPNGGNGPGSGNTPVGGGAPIGEGLIILMSLGIGYSARKIHDVRERNKTLTDE